MNLFTFHSTWDWNDARKELVFENARLLASEGWSLDNVKKEYCPSFISARSFYLIVCI